MLIQKKKEKLKAEIKDSKLTSPFLDLINQYTQRGYKIPDLSTKKNIFVFNYTFKISPAEINFFGGHFFIFSLMLPDDILKDFSQSYF